MSREISSITALADFCLKYYGIEGKDLSVLLLPLIEPYTGYNPLWITIESSGNLFIDHLSYVVQQLGMPEILDVNSIRVAKVRDANEKLEEIDRKQRRIFLDSVYRMPYWRMPHPRNLYYLFNCQCVRVRVSVDPFRIPPPDAEKKLAELISKVLPKGLSPRPVQPNSALQAYIKLLSLLNEELTNISALTQNLCLIPTCHAVLHKRDELQERDWWVQRRVLQDTVRWWTGEILKVFVENENTSEINEIHRMTDIRRDYVISELNRLAANGVLEWPKPKYKGKRERWIRITKEWRQDLFSLFNSDAQWW